MNGASLSDRRFKDRSKIAFVVWAPHSERANGISETLHADLYLTSYKFKTKIFSPVKYPVLFLRTIMFLSQQRPEIILCQVPPIFCPLTALTYKSLFNRKVKFIIDAHSAAIDNIWSYLKPLNGLIMKRASGVLVTNLEAQNHVLREYGIHALILEDKIPKFDLKRSSKLAEHRESSSDSQFKTVIPSSFAHDEPIEAILKAAEELKEIKFYLTGDNSRLDKALLATKADNVEFTGFLQKTEYVNLLSDSDAVMALTTRDKTMLAGAYDAIALEKPLITSNWPSLKRYFDKGTVHIDNSTPSIVNAIRIVQQRKKEMAYEMSMLKEKRIHQWEESLRRLEKIIAD